MSLESRRILIWLCLGGALSACDGSGTGSGVRLPDISYLTTPVTLKAPVASQEGIPLTWDPVDNAVSYALYRCELPSGITDDLIASAPVETCGPAITYSKTPAFTDFPPLTAPQAYVYHLRACADLVGQLCGSVIGSVAAAQAAPVIARQMTTQIGDEGRQVISGLTTTLHATPQGATGSVSWQWTQESGTKVNLMGADTPDVSFVAPDVDTNTLLSFELRVSDDKGIGAPSKVAITVVPAQNVSVKAGSPSRLAQSGHQVSLHARGSDPNLTYMWRQLSPATPQVELLDANTANPTFMVPTMLQGGILYFEVTATDPVTGRNAAARTSVAVQYPVPILAPTPIEIPNQTPNQVPNPVPIATPMLVPMQILQPLQNNAVPLPNAVLIPPKVPPQALLLIASPAAVATGGSSIQLGMTASGGREPYLWSWSQTSGPDAILTDANSEVVTVKIPEVTSAQTLTFQLTLTDADGLTRSAQAEVQATLPPQQIPTPVPVASTPLEPRLVVVNETVPVFTTPLTEVTTTQVSGPQLEIVQNPLPAAGTEISLRAPLLKDDSAHASLNVRGKDPKGQTLSYIVPVIIIRPPALAPAPENPPQVLPPQAIPRQDDPLVFAAGVTGLVMSEGSSRVLGIAVQGGKGSASYRYLWSYLKDPGGPDISFSRETTARMLLTAPAVDKPTLLRFSIQVTDGAQTIARDVVVQVNDLAPTLVAGALVPLTVDSGQTVSLSAPVPSGGVQFGDAGRYRYTLTQAGGVPAVTLSPVGEYANEHPSNWSFTAPTLAPGAADAVLQFEYSISDRVGNLIKVNQIVTVVAPPLPQVPPLAPRISLPASLQFGVPLRLQADATGGTPPYSFAWTVHPEVQVKAGAAPFVLTDIQATGENPQVMPDTLGSRFTDVADYRLKVHLRVTDANQVVAETSGETHVILVEQARPATMALVCGDLASETPCTDLELVLGMTEQCPAEKPYAMNDIYVKGLDVTEYHRCVNAQTAYTQFVLGSRLEPRCRNFSPPTVPQTYACHLACYGEGCNIDTIPPDSELLGPVGSDGFMAVGIPPLP